MNAVETHWCERFGITHEQYQTLKRAVGRAVDAQEEEHNSTPATNKHLANRATRLTGKVNELAKELGLGIDWRSGLYPRFIKGERSDVLPD